MKSQKLIDKILDELKKKRGAAYHEKHRKVIEKFVEREPISHGVGHAEPENRTFGERLADRVASFGGSWTFIAVFFLALVSWVILNSYILARSGDAFDPFPYILLNLFLSMLAAVQAPVILMSQNRQAAKDRENAEHDYEVNLKAELEVRLLHEKLDELREHKWAALVEMQQEQIRMLEKLLSEGGGGKQK
ncbi:MAG: DUF1003 domain-containing protein [Acidobacteria bacterium]|nr:DUF1003 domain-containing protein [Acidobacteriota bacterium]